MTPKNYQVIKKVKLKEDAVAAQAESSDNKKKIAGAQRKVR